MGDDSSILCGGRVMSNETVTECDGNSHSICTISLWCTILYASQTLALALALTLALVLVLGLTLVLALRIVETPTLRPGDPAAVHSRERGHGDDQTEGRVMARLSRVRARAGFH